VVKKYSYLTIVDNTLGKYSYKEYTDKDYKYLLLNNLLFKTFFYMENYEIDNTKIILIIDTGGDIYLFNRLEKTTLQIDYSINDRLNQSEFYKKTFLKTTFDVKDCTKEPTKKYKVKKTQSNGGTYDLFEDAENLGTLISYDKFKGFIICISKKDKKSKDKISIFKEGQLLDEKNTSFNNEKK